MTSETKWYGVSSGNGNDGVSHMFPDYYVKTNDPWRLAYLAAVTEFKDEFQQWAKENVEVDGETEYTISASFYSMPDDDENCERDYCPLIIAVFPETDNEWFDKREAPKYESIEDCFGDDAAKIPVSD